VADITFAPPRTSGLRLIAWRGASCLAINVASAAASFAIGVALARIGGASAAGAFGLGTSLAFACTGVVGAGVANAAIDRRGGQRDGTDLTEIAGAAVITSLLVVVVGGAILTQLDIAPAERAVLAISLASAPFICLGFELNDYLRGLGDHGGADRSLIARLAVSTIGSAIALTAGLGVVGVTVAFASQWPVGAGVSAHRLRRLGVTPRPGRLRSGIALIRSAWWFQAPKLGLTISGAGALVALRLNATSAQVGVFAAAAGAAQALRLVPISFGTVAFGQLRVRSRSPRRDGTTTTNWVIVLTAMLALVAAVASPLLARIYGAGFGTAGTLLLILLPGAVATTSALCDATTLNACGQSGTSGRVALIAAVGAVVASLIAAPLAGATGVAAALSVTAIAHAVWMRHLTHSPE
jgi:O-antigen/teichoic acid export membrane protein